MLKDDQFSLLRFAHPADFASWFEEIVSTAAHMIRMQQDVVKSLGAALEQLWKPQE